jgi:hypothetical protein
LGIEAPATRTVRCENKSEVTNYTEVLCIVVSCLIATFSLRPAAADTIFQDTFDDGNPADAAPVTWVPQAGTWDASSGDYVVGGPGLKESRVPEHILADKSVRTRVRLSGQGVPRRGVAIQFRRQAANNNLGYGASVLADGLIGIFRLAPFVDLGSTIVPFDVLATTSCSRLTRSTMN